VALPACVPARLTLPLSPWPGTGNPPVRSEPPVAVGRAVRDAQAATMAAVAAAVAATVTAGESTLAGRLQGVVPGP